MQKLTEFLSLALTLLICCGEMLQAMPIPAEVPGNPIYYKRLHRVRPSHKKDIDIYEIRELYYVRRTTPKPKIQSMTDEEMDQRIRCDFEPTLPECTKLTTKPSTSSTTTVPTTTEATVLTSTTTMATTTTIGTTPATTTTTTSTSTTTTDIPLLPELPLESNDLVGETETTTPSEDEDYEIINPDDDKSEYDAEEDENNDDDVNMPEDYINSGGSIGGNDLTK